MFFMCVFLNLFVTFVTFCLHLYEKRFQLRDDVTVSRQVIAHPLDQHTAVSSGSEFSDCSVCQLAQVSHQMLEWNGTSASDWFRRIFHIEPKQL